MVLVAVGEMHESLQIMLPRNEVAGCLSVLCVAVDIAKVRGDMKVFLCDDHNGQINLRAKQKYEVLSATYVYNVCVCVKSHSVFMWRNKIG